MRAIWRGKAIAYETVLGAMSRLAALALPGEAAPRVKRLACPHGDKTCPCQDGDTCHYEGHNPMTPPGEAAQFERCDGRYPVPPTSPPRQEPFEVTYRCGLPAGHSGPHGSGEAAPPAQETQE